MCPSVRVIPPQRWLEVYTVLDFATERSLLCKAWVGGGGYLVITKGNQGFALGGTEGFSHTTSRGRFVKLKEDSVQEEERRRTRKGGEEEGRRDKK